MSNYYKSDCCEEQVKTELRGATFEYICLKCDLPCKVIAVIDTPGGVPKDVKQYQEDIKAGVDVGNFQFINPITSNDPKAIEICETIRQQLNKIPNDK